MATTIIRAKGIEKKSSAEVAALYNAAKWIGIDPDFLAIIEDFESGLNEKAINPNSGASGVIQWLPSTAARLFGLQNTAENRQIAINRVRKMSFIQQQELVKKYFAPYRGKLKTLEDLYLVVFYPAAIGKPSDFIVGSAGGKVYDQNAGFDFAKKGYITKTDITSTIRNRYQAAINLPRVEVAIGVGGALLTAAAGWGMYKLITNKGKFSNG